ncbi:MAG TPA: hypothetical protein VFX85_10255 [Solirubrobacterales bacterium]|nr:hypothetical protein [Solirubrobacterales bacterium]
MAWSRAALVLVATGAVAAVLVSGGHSADPRTPAALPGLPPPFLGTAVVGGGELTAAIDAYGDVVDLRATPAGRELVDNSYARQVAETVPAGTGIVPRLSVGNGRARPLWQADAVMQRYLPGTNVVRTVARFGSAWGEIVYAAGGSKLACLTRTSPGSELTLAVADPAAAARLRCDDGTARSIVRAAARSDRRWLMRARTLGRAAPPWAVRLYERSLLTLRALTDRRSGAAVAGARDGWAYVWPRDAGTTALALAAGGYEPEARRVARFLLGLDLEATARFHGDGTPIAGRDAQGDAAGWTAVAARAAGLRARVLSLPWRDRADYQEGVPGDYLGNAIAGGDASDVFETARGLVRAAGDPGSGLDSAAAWAVRPFSQPSLHPAARRTLLRLAGKRTRFGIVPGEDWNGGIDPWMAPTAWSAWSLAALGERGAALRLLAALRRAATPAGALPERVDVRTGIPRSTTPLAWSHAFAILALRELWP